MHDGDELVTCQEGRQFFVGDALFGEADQQRRGYQHQPDSRIRQALVDSAHHRNAEGKVLLAEPNFDTSRHEQLVQLFGWPLPVVPRVAQEDVTKVRLHRCSRLNGLADWRE